MIWVALLLGIFLGWLAHEVSGFILLHPLASVEKLTAENEQLTEALAKMSEVNDQVLVAARLQMQDSLNVDQRLVAALAEAAAQGFSEVIRCERCGSFLTCQSVANAGDDKHNGAG